jgi:hypothetical protein
MSPIILSATDQAYLTNTRVWRHINPLGIRATVLDTLKGLPQTPFEPMGRRRGDWIRKENGSETAHGAEEPRIHGMKYELEALSLWTFARFR